MGIPLKAGRDFGPQDFDENAPLVGIANEALVRQYFQNENPVGKRVGWARDSEVHWITIVGVAGDVKHFGLDLPEQPGLLFSLPTDQSLEALDVVCSTNARRSVCNGPGIETRGLESRFAVAGDQGGDNE